MVETLNANVSLEKTRIVSVLKQKGPSVANSIGKTLELPNILTCAILSELTAEKIVKASNLKVGGSPLYYLPGQEIALENFLKFLELKEREAFARLKEAGILVDVELEPAIRVALRNIKDYAVPLRVNVNNADKVIWKYFLLRNEDAEIKVNELFKKEEKKVEEVKPEAKPEIRKEVKQDQRAQERITSQDNNKEEIQKIKPETKEEEKPKLKERKKKALKTDLKGVAEKWLSKNKAELKKEIEGKESFVISIPSEIGKLDFLLILKNKKVIEGDLAIAYQEGLSQRLPVILLHKGKPSKKVIEYASTFGGHLVLKELE